MKTNKRMNYINIIAALTYIIMILVNALANILPINGITTGEVSDSFSNLFAPAGITFAIWGVIYALLLGYTIYQLGFFRSNKTEHHSRLLEKVSIAFSISSIINATWVFSWHYKLFLLSEILIVALLLTLMYIALTIKNEKLGLKEKLLVKVPFSVYFGWLTVATIANTTVLLVSKGWNGFGISEVVWTILILIVGTIITSLTTIINKDVAYGLVPIWAYFGIYIKHTSVNGFAGKYPSIITTVITCLAVLIIVLIYTIYKVIRKK